MLENTQTIPSKKGDDMDLQEDAIVDIPANRVRYFGRTGKMLLPSPATVAALIQTIPEHQLLTTDILRKKLTAQFNVQGTCPVTTRKALQAVARDSNTQVAYWRVIKKSGELLADFPGGVEGHAALLRKEGFPIEAHGKVPKVKAFAERLVRFE
jgi:alkylated DNA nucleotide flippase Atl1